MSFKTTKSLVLSGREINSSLDLSVKSSFHCTIHEIELNNFVKCDISIFKFIPDC